MVEVLLRLPNSMVSRLQTEDGGAVTGDFLSKKAIALIEWALEQKEQNRKIVSVDNNGKQKGIVNIPLMKKIR